MKITEKLPSRLEVVPAFVLAAMDKLSRLPIDEGDAFNIKLCLEEALVNAVKHGNKFDPELSVQVSLDIEGERLTIKVVNEGEGFDFKSIPDPTRADNLKKLSGRGVFLIKKLMDEVSFFDSGRGIKMVKFIKTQKERAKSDYA